jgi:hypothetical protein
MKMEKTTHKKKKKRRRRRKISYPYDIIKEKDK